MARPLNLTTRGFLPGAAKPLFVTGLENLGALEDFAMSYVASGDPLQSLVADTQIDFTLFGAEAGVQGDADPNPGIGSITLTSA